MGFDAKVAARRPQPSPRHVGSGLYKVLDPTSVTQAFGGRAGLVILAAQWPRICGSRSGATQPSGSLRLDSMSEPTVFFSSSIRRIDRQDERAPNSSGLEATAAASSKKQSSIRKHTAEASLLRGRGRPEGIPSRRPLTPNPVIVRLASPQQCSP